MDFVEMVNTSGDVGIWGILYLLHKLNQHCTKIFRAHDETFHEHDKRLALIEDKI